MERTDKHTNQIVYRALLELKMVNLLIKCTCWAISNHRYCTYGVISIHKYCTCEHFQYFYVGSVMFKTINLPNQIQRLSKLNTSDLSLFNDKIQFHVRSFLVFPHKWQCFQICSWYQPWSWYTLHILRPVPGITMQGKVFWSVLQTTQAVSLKIPAPRYNSELFQY